MNYKLDAYIKPFKFTQSVRFKLQQNTRILLTNLQTQMKQLHPAYTQYYSINYVEIKAINLTSCTKCYDL